AREIFDLLRAAIFGEREIVFGKIADQPSTLVVHRGKYIDHVSLNSNGRRRDVFRGLLCLLLLWSCGSHQESDQQDRRRANKEIEHTDTMGDVSPVPIVSNACCHPPLERARSGISQGYRARGSRRDRVSL